MKRDVQLPGLATAAEFTNGHRSLIEVIHRDSLATEVDDPGHVVGDLGWQVGVAEKGPAAEIDARDILIHLRIVFARQYGARKADLFHMLQRPLIYREKTHP